ncbi:hypothetical protein JCM8202v2_004257 [Rhodotorula sphaerocarpa]
MVWHEAEPGFHIHMTVQLPQSSRRQRSTSTTTEDGNAVTAAPPIEIHDEALIAALRQSHRRFRLRHGTLSAILDRDGKDRLVELLDRHWTFWLSRFDVAKIGTLEHLFDSVPQSAFLTPATSLQLGPLLTQFAASNPTALPILLHRRDVLALPKLPPPNATARPEPGRPPPPPVHEDELVDLVRYLADTVPESTILAVAPEPLSGFAETALTAPPTSSSWSSSLSTLANGMSFFSPRPLSLSFASLPGPNAASAQSKRPASSSTSRQNVRAGFAALRKQEQAALASAAAPPATQPVDASRQRPNETEPTQPNDPEKGWSLRKIGWGTLGFDGGLSAADQAKAAAAAAAATADRSEEASQPGQVVLGDGSNPRSEGAEDEAPPVQPDGPETPGVELAPAVDAEELAAAIGLTPEQQDKKLEPIAVKTEVGETGREGAEPDGREEEDEAAAQKVLEVFVGGHSETDLMRAHVRRYTRGLLTLGLAVLPSTDEAAVAWLDSRAERLLEAVETVTEVLEVPSPVYPHRHLVQVGPMLASSAESGPTGGSESAGTTAAEVESNAALFNAFRALHRPPAVLESLTRLSSGRWALHRQHTRAPTTVVTPFESSRPDAGVAPARVTRVYALAPSKTSRGRDLSLVEAADELRRIERAYEGM